jgi:hypothetical protein
LHEATSHSTAERCALCAGAICSPAIGRVVHAPSEKRPLQLTGNPPEDPTLSPCSEVFARGQRELGIVAPWTQEHVAAAHEHCRRPR